MRRTTSTPRTSRPQSTGSPPRSPGADGALRGLAGPRVLAAEPDERLVALARAGDERAFAAIVERYRPPLLRYARGYLPPAAADDALQQAFINAYAALTSETANAPASLRPWLYRVTRNAALNVARDPQAAHAPLPDGLGGVERPDEALQRSERLRAVVGAVRTLPAKQRQAIVRHALDGDSHEQIAADIGVSAGAIRQLVHRARQTVREAAAAVLPVPVLRWLPWNLAESAPALGGGSVAAKVAAAVVATAVAGGGTAEVVRHERARPTAAHAVRAQPLAEISAAAALPVASMVAPPRISRQEPAGIEAGDDPGSGSSGSGDSGRGSSGSGSSGSDSSGSGSSGGGASGSGSSGSGSSGSGSSGSGSSGSGISGGDSSGSDSSGSGSSGSDSSGSGSSGSGTSGSGSSGSGTYALATPTPTPSPTSSGSGSSGSGSSGSGSSGSGSGDD